MREHVHGALHDKEEDVDGFFPRAVKLLYVGQSAICSPFGDNCSQVWDLRSRLQ
jgi:hypothetical protein